jgi:hypothetical protein
MANFSADTIDAAARLVEAAGHDRPVVKPMPAGMRADQLALLRLFDLRGVDELKVQELRGEPVADTPFVRDLIAKNHGRPLTREMVEQAGQAGLGDTWDRLVQAVEFTFKPYGGFVQKLWESRPNVEFIAALPLAKFQQVFGFRPSLMVQRYSQLTNHPTAGPDRLTVGWVRYTDLDDDAWVNEIQTDLTNGDIVAHDPEGFGRLGPALGGLDQIALWTGEQFVREARARGIGRIMMPTLKIKKEHYNAQPVPPRSAFEDLPRRLRFRRKPYGELGLAGDMDSTDIQQAVLVEDHPDPRAPRPLYGVTPDGQNWLLFGREGAGWRFWGEAPDRLFQQLPNEPIDLDALPDGLEAASDDIQVDTDIPADEPVWVLAGRQVQAATPRNTIEFGQFSKADQLRFQALSDTIETLERYVDQAYARGYHDVATALDELLTAMKDRLESWFEALEEEGTQEGDLPGIEEELALLFEDWRRFKAFLRGDGPMPSRHFDEHGDDAGKADLIRMARFVIEDYPIKPTNWDLRPDVRDDEVFDALKDAWMNSKMVKSAKRPDSDGYLVDQVLKAIPARAWSAVMEAAGLTGQGKPTVDPRTHSFEWSGTNPSGPVGLTVRGSFVRARDGEWVVRAVRLDDPDRSAELHDLFAFDAQRDARAILVAALRVLRELGGGHA